MHQGFQRWNGTSFVQNERLYSSEQIHTNSLERLLTGQCLARPSARNYAALNMSFRTQTSTKNFINFIILVVRFSVVYSSARQSRSFRSAPLKRMRAEK